MVEILQLYILGCVGLVGLVVLVVLDCEGRSGYV